MSSPPDTSPSPISPPSNSSASPPTSDSSPPPSTPPPTSNSTSPTPDSSSPPPDSPPPDSPPPDSSPPPQIPDPPVSSTPPPSTSEPPPPNETPPPSSPPVSSPPPSIPPPVIPSTPNAPPPRNVSPPPLNPPTRPSSPPPPSPPAVTPPSPSPPARTLPPPSPPAPPRQSPPAPKLPPPPTDLPPTFPPPSVPTSSSPPPSPANELVPGNPTASEPPTPTNSTSTSPSTRGGGGLPAGGVIAIVLVAVLALSLVVFALCFIHRRKKKRPGPDSGHMAPPPILPSQNPDSFSIPTQTATNGSGHQSPYQSANLSGSDSTTKAAYNGDPGGSRSFFTYEELVKATNGFSEDNILGEGGFGYVYKGNLPDGREVAVKQLKIGSGQGEREFKAEVEIISRIHHRHLVSIVGYCISDSQRLLVYDYVPNNTLHYHLHGNASVMTWPTRFKVASGAARGIAYLHEDCIPRIIHRDIKSANILLDNNFEAKVADFGLAKLALELEAQTHVSTRVMGTFGYMAPEYATSGKLTDKSDVYSFGVVLLELITGRKPVDSSRPVGDESLVEWARPLLTQALENGNFQNLVDSRLENNYVKIEMFRLTEAAAACVRHSASKRPKMTQVLRALDSIGQMSDLTNGMKPGDSQIVDSREQSAEIRLFQRMAFGNQDYDSDLFSNSHSSWSG